MVISGRLIVHAPVCLVSVVMVLIWLSGSCVLSNTDDLFVFYDAWIQSKYLCSKGHAGLAKEGICNHPNELVRRMDYRCVAI